MKHMDRHARLAGLVALCAHLTILPAAQAEDQKTDPIGIKLEQLRSLIHKDKTEDLSVPPVYNRPLGADAGPRVHVNQFIVEGIIEHPEAGITQEKINELAETARLELQSLHVLNEYGLTDQDHAVIGSRLKDTLYEDADTLRETYNEILEQVRRDKKYREEMSIGQLQEVANRLTDYYRSSGFIIAQVYVPEQEVQGGVVRLRVSEGVLGNIIVEDNQDYTEEVLSQRFVGLQGETVEKVSLETGLLSLSDYPGLIAYGVLQPGTETGTSDLVIKVQEEESHGYSIRAENYGSDLTGEYRLTLTYKAYNPLGNADDLSVNLLTAFSPANTVYGDINYRFPVTGTDVLLGTSLSSNAFDIGGALASSGVSGTVNAFDMFGSYQFIRSRTVNSYGRLKFAHKVASTEISGSPLKEDVLSMFNIETGFDVLDRESQSINKGTVTLSVGLEGFLGSLDAITAPEDSSRVGGSGEYGTSSFLKLNWDLARLQLIDKYQNILYRLSGQYSDDLLVAVEQAGMGGPSNVRAFGVSEYLRDSAVFLSADWNFNAPGFYDSTAFDNWKWGEILQFSAFGDVAFGKQNDPTANDIETVTMLGIGVGAQLLLPGKMQVRMDIGYPLYLYEDGSEVTGSDDTQFYFTFSYSG